jgi:acyl-CoA thioesterase I
MKKFLSIILLFFACNHFAFAKNTILVLGDSLSAGYGLAMDKGWPTLLQKKINEHHYQYMVINLSISGNTTLNGLEMLPDALKRYHPAIVLIALGANDGLRGLNLSVIKENLQKMITLAKKSSHVILIGVRLPRNYGAAFNQQFEAMFSDLARKNQITLIPQLLKNVDDREDLMQADGLHPSAAAQPLILENVWPFIEKAIAQKNSALRGTTPVFVG